MITDPKARRDTPLARRIKDRIRREGPISVAQYMRMCLGDPDHGYYVKQPVIGAAGDFITAPEISQIFGELIGLWCAVVWQQMGSPEKINLMELGPGRGTLMRDALRAARKVPGFHGRLSLHFVEASEVLAAHLHAALDDSDIPIEFYQRLTQPFERMDGATIVIGNEFLDALPIEQFEYTRGRWRSRQVSLDAGGLLTFAVNVAAPSEPLEPSGVQPYEGTVFECCAQLSLLADRFAHHARRAPLAALLIDYGHNETGLGDTLQGVHRHQHVSPFFAPGETDLTAQVDFETLATAMKRSGLAVDGPLTQAELLGKLGAIERASSLMAANPATATRIEAGVVRLMAPNGMGTRFKAIGVRSPGLPPLPGFV